jgi:PIN domain nuclease of toxin-antitoxin system
MTYLLDTHFIIWAVSDTAKLSKKVKAILAEPDNKILVSTISFWEISLKHSLGKLKFVGGTPEDVPYSCLQMGFEIEPLSAVDSSTYHKLKATYHKDPFDRMLIWQAISNDYTFLSADSNAKKYVSEGLKIFAGK